MPPKQAPQQEKKHRCPFPGCAFATNRVHEWKVHLSKRKTNWAADELHNQQNPVWTPELIKRITIQSRTGQLTAAQKKVCCPCAPYSVNSLTGTKEKGIEEIPQYT
jgi:hypothetical protein